jgi:2-polyprenyl-3-methyl-5-hydroxy-6-metoxy-1,4-benzoquinol methylase
LKEHSGADDDTRLFYDLTAEETAARWYDNESLLPSLREFLALLPERPRVLDLGCGPGYESMRLAREGAEVVGLDFSGESIRIARKRNPDLRFEQADIFTLDTSLGTFDGILAAAILIHVPSERMEEFLRNVCVLLNPGGVLAVAYQGGSGFRSKDSEVAGRKLRRLIYLYGQAELVTAFSIHGLVPLKEGHLDPELVKAGWRLDYFHKA